MAETSATKLGEVTKKFKAVNKEVIAKLAEYGETVKASTSVITDEQAAMVVDILTQENMFTPDMIVTELARAAGRRVQRVHRIFGKRNIHDKAPSLASTKTTSSSAALILSARSA
jgi:hypothetical protein